MDVNGLLDRAKETTGVKTDGELAGKLGVKPSAVSNYRHGRAQPDAVTCATLAGLTGEPLAKVLGIVGEARAISREEKAVWRKLAATVAVLTMMVFPALSERAHAATGWAETPARVDIMRNIGWGDWGWWLWLVRLFLNRPIPADKPSKDTLEAFAC